MYECFYIKIVFYRNQVLLIKRFFLIFFLFIIIHSLAAQPVANRQNAVSHIRTEARESPVCNSYIQIRQKAISENICPDFTFSISGDMTSGVMLNDRPGALDYIFDISGDRDGGLFAIANTGNSYEWYENPGLIYYRASGSSEWRALGEAFKISGIHNGGYLSLFRSPSSGENDYTADRIRYRSDSSGAEVDITGNLSGELFVEVAGNYSDILYVLVSTAEGEGTIYKKSVSDLNWVSTGITHVQSFSAIPNTSQIVYAKSAAPDRNQIYISDNDNTNVLAWGNPIPLWDDDKIKSLAVTYEEDGALNLWALSEPLVYRGTSPSAWEEEYRINDMRLLTSTGGKLLYTMLADHATDIPERLFFRTQTGAYLDDERVRTDFNSNVVNIPVCPGTYTITQDPLTGWHLTDLQIFEPESAGSIIDKISSSATIVVSDNEVVVVEFENQLTQNTPISAICGETGFVEDFSSFASGDWGLPLAGLTSYHKATGNFGYGHYAIVSSSDVLKYGADIYDHTTGNETGSFMLIDATFERGIFYRRRLTGLVSGGKYSFGAWIANYNPPASDKPNVSFEIYDLDGNLLSLVNSGDVLTSDWSNFSTTYVSDGSDIDIVLRNNKFGTAGNDLAIDDISFGLAIPAPELATSISDCYENTGTVTFLAPISMGTEDLYEYSIDSLEWQTSPFFTGVEGGTYTAYVRYKDDLSGVCVARNIFILEENCLVITGTVFRDGNGNTIIDNTEDRTTAGIELYVYLVDIEGVVVDSAKVAPDGFYILHAAPNQNYTIELSQIQYPIGTNVSISLIDNTPPAGWVTTGENGNNNTGLGDGVPDGKLAVSVGTTDVYHQNFGIQEPPLADAKIYYVPNSAFSKTPPAGYPPYINPDNPDTGYFTIVTDNSMLTGYTYKGSLTGRDVEDCPSFESCNTGSRFVLDSLYEGTVLYYNYGGETGVRQLALGDTIHNYDPSELVIYASEGLGMATPVGFTYSIVDNAGFSSSAVTYTIFTESALPVELLYFIATTEDCKVKLSWASASELNNDYFEVERSADAKVWKQIGRIDGNGTSSARHDYGFEDTDIQAGTLYYRLKQVDFDGTTEYHKTISVDGKKCSSYEVKVYPNPASVQFTVEVQDEILKDASRQIILTDVEGREILRINSSEDITKIDVSNLPTGTYLVRILSGKESIIIKQVIVVK